MIYLVAYLFLEVLVSVNISSVIGSIATFFEIILSAMYGITILVNFKKSIIENMTAVSYSCIDLNEFQRLNLFTLFGAIFLILPGFLTDILGILMQFSVFTTMLINRYNVKFGKCKTNFDKEKESDVIDVEIIEYNNTHK